MDRQGLLLSALGFILAVGTLAAVDLQSSDRSTDTVNAVLGDASWVARFGEKPGPEAPESLRLRTHLEYVERLLRGRPTGHLTAAQRAARSRNLDRLAVYTRRGEYPRRTVSTGDRRPVFIDANGRICAVGYLIEQSLGRGVAERLDAAWHTAYIDDMRLPLIDDWAEKAGFTRGELAMIQPAYCDPGACLLPEPDRFDPALETSVMIAGAAGASLNSFLAGRGRPNPVAAGAGMALGITSLAFGMSERANYEAGDLVVGGLAVAAAGWSLVESLGAPDEETMAASEIPTAGIGLIPAAEGPLRLGLVLRWSY